MAIIKKGILFRHPPIMSFIWKKNIERVCCRFMMLINYLNYLEWSRIAHHLILAKNIAGKKAFCCKGLVALGRKSYANVDQSGLHRLYSQLLLVVEVVRKTYALLGLRTKIFLVLSVTQMKQKQSFVSFLFVKFSYLQGGAT